MTKAQQFREEARSSASPEVVFAVLADATTWSTWAGPLVLDSRWEAGGPQGGVGAIRRLGKGPLAAREQIVEQDPPRRFAYELLSWHPYRDYLGEVRLEKDGGGTRILWSGGFSPRVPGTGRVQRLVLQRIVGDFASRLATHTSQHGQTGPKTQTRPSTPSTGEPT